MVERTCSTILESWVQIFAKLLVCQEVVQPLRASLLSELEGGPSVHLTAYHQRKKNVKSIQGLAQARHRESSLTWFPSFPWTLRMSPKVENVWKTVKEHGGLQG